MNIARDVTPPGFGASAIAAPRQLLWVLWLVTVLPCASVQAARSMRDADPSWSVRVGAGVASRRDYTGSDN